MCTSCDINRSYLRYVPRYVCDKVNKAHYANHGLEFHVNTFFQRLDQARTTHTHSWTMAAVLAASIWIILQSYQHRHFLVMESALCSLHVTTDRESISTVESPPGNQSQRGKVKAGGLHSALRGPPSSNAGQMLKRTSGSSPPNTDCILPALT